MPNINIIEDILNINIEKYNIDIGLPKDIYNIISEYLNNDIKNINKELIKNIDKLDIIELVKNPYSGPILEYIINKDNIDMKEIKYIKDQKRGLKKSEIIFEQKKENIKPYEYRLHKLLRKQTKKNINMESKLYDLWSDINKNPSCLLLLKKFPMKINHLELIKNPNPNTIDFLFTTINIYELIYKYKSTHNEIFSILLEKCSKNIYLQIKDIFRGEFSEKFIWSSISINPNLIDILIENIDKIEWNYLMQNENIEAMNLILKNIDKINWLYISKNPNFYLVYEKEKKLVSNNASKILWNIVCEQPNIIPYLNEILTEFIEYKNSIIKGIINNPEKLIITKNKIWEEIINTEKETINPTILEYFIKYLSIDELPDIEKSLTINPHSLQTIDRLSSSDRKFYNIKSSIFKNPSSLDIIKRLTLSSSDYDFLWTYINWEFISFNPTALKLLTTYEGNIFSSELYDKRIKCIDKYLLLLKYGESSILKNNKNIDKIYNYIPKLTNILFNENKGTSYKYIKNIQIDIDKYYKTKIFDMDRFITEYKSRINKEIKNYKDILKKNNKPYPSNKYINILLHNVIENIIKTFPVKDLYNKYGYPLTWTEHDDEELLKQLSTLYIDYPN